MSFGSDEFDVQRVAAPRHSSDEEASPVAEFGDPTQVVGNKKIKSDFGGMNDAT